MQSYYVITYTPKTKVNARLVKLSLQLPDSNLLISTSRNYFIKQENIKEKERKICVAMFEDGSYEILERYKSTLIEVVNKLCLNKNMKVSLIGHSCSYGDKYKEDGESVKLARIIYDFLIQNGVKINQIRQTIGYGYEEPVYFDDTDPIKRKENRRVEVLYEN